MKKKCIQGAIVIRILRERDKSFMYFPIVTQTTRWAILDGAKFDGRWGKDLYLGAYERGHSKRRGNLGGGGVVIIKIFKKISLLYLDPFTLQTQNRDTG